MMLITPQEPMRKEGYDEFDSRERILFGTMELVANHGFEAASTRAIAQQANLTIGMIWKIFGTKENLFQDIDNHTALVIDECFRNTPVQHIDDLPQWITNVGGEFSRTHVLEFAYFRRALAENNESANRLLTAYASQCRKHLEGMRKRGLVKADVDLNGLTLTTLFIAVGILIAGPWLYETGGTRGFFSKKGQANYRDFLRQMLVNGVGESN